MIQMIVAAEGTISINCHFLFSISGFGTVLIPFHTCWHLYQQYFQIVDYVVSSIFSLVYSQVDTFTINISSNAPHSWPLSPTYFVYSLFISYTYLYFFLYVSCIFPGKSQVDTFIINICSNAPPQLTTFTHLWLILYIYSSQPADILKT